MFCQFSCAFFLPTLRNKMAGWREEQPQPGVVRGWMVRKVNSEQKKRASQKNKFRLGRAICLSIDRGGHEGMKTPLQEMKIGGTSVRVAPFLARAPQLIPNAAQENR